MDRSIRNEVSERLNTLPPAVLGLVAFYLSVDELFTMVLVGNIGLSRNLLGHGGVTSLECDEREIPFRSSFDFFLRSLPSLTDVKVAVPNWFLNHWLKLPSTLTRIDNFVGEYYQVPEDPNDFSISDRFPKLRSLSVNAILSSKSASTLPPSLESLKIYEIASQCFLPASLTSLDLYEVSQMPVFVSPLPNLRKVVIRVKREAILEFSMFLASLPQTLEHLELDVHGNLDGSVDVSVTHLLPSGLRTLRCDNVSFTSSSDLITFPPHLTHLNIIGNPSIGLFAPLPRSLRHFGLAEWLRTEFPSSLFLLLPPNLESFMYGGYFDNWMEWEVGTLLPDTLTSLEAPRCKFSISALSSLPKSLQKLNIGEILEDTMTEEEPLVWPLQTLALPNLTSFALDSQSSVGVGHASNANTHVPASLFQCLAIGCPKLVQCFISCRFTFNGGIMRDHFQHDIPLNAHIKFLQSFSSINAKYLAHQSSEKDGNGNSMSIIHKPSNGQCYRPFVFSDSLKVFWVPDLAFGDELVATLPISSSLTSLVLPSSPFITDACFVHTIQYLHSLEKLHCPCPTVTGRAFFYLPRKLEYLEFSGSASSLILDDHIFHLPPTLTCLLLFAPFLTDSCAPTLPRNLKELTIYHNQKITKSIVPYCFANGLRTFTTTKFRAYFHHGTTKFLW